MGKGRKRKGTGGWTSPPTPRLVLADLWGVMKYGTLSADREEGVGEVTGRMGGRKI